MQIIQICKEHKYFSEGGTVLEKLKIYQPKINEHIFSANAHPDTSESDSSDMKIWCGDDMGNAAVTP